jgi:hypothetical protein
MTDGSRIVAWHRDMTRQPSTGLGAAAAALGFARVPAAGAPLTATAQRMRRSGILMREAKMDGINDNR